MVFLLLSIYLSYRDLKLSRLSLYFDRFLFTVLGLLGICLLLLWIATSHQAAAKNFNLLWALPTHLIAVVALRRKGQWLKKYFLGVTVLCVLLLLTWAVLPQKLHYSLIPFVMAIGFRAFTQYKVRKLVA
jgi:hypothetical protein